MRVLAFVQLPEHELKKKNLGHLRSFCKAVYPFRIPSDDSKVKLAQSLFMNLFSPLPFVAQKYDVPRMRQKIREVIGKHKIDLVHVDLLPLAVYVNEFKEIPKIIVNHNVESMRLLRWMQSEKNPVKKTFLRAQWLKLRSFERHALNQFDHGVAVSELDKEILVQMGVKIPLSVVPNGTDTRFFKPMGRKIIEDSVVWIGHMDVHTNRDAVLYFWREIYPLLRKKYPPVRITFVGTAPPKEIADASRNSGQVQVTGFVDDVRPYIDEAAVMIVPIRIGSGTRLKILDAMAMGKAIVSTSVGCEGLNVAHGKNISIADSAEDLTERIIELMMDPEKRSAIEKGALQLAKAYDWNLITDKQETVYQRVMNGRMP